MNALLKTFTRRLTTDSFDRQLGQWFCWISAVTLLILGLRKVAALELTEAQLMVGALLSVATATLFAVAGLGLWLGSILQPSTRPSRRP